MIVVRLIGGLGNQMFAYAMAKSLALKYNVQLKLDLSWINEVERDKNLTDVYGLKHLNVSDGIAREKDINQFLSSSKLIKKIFFRINKSLPYKNKWILEESSFEFNQQISSVRSSLYIYNGYWQSYKYFESYAQEIKDIFSFKNEISAINLALADQIQSCEAVSVHIRRGDYANNPHLAKLYQTFGLEYYTKSIDYMKQNLDNPIFFVFSDDIEWAKGNLPNNPAMIFVDNNKEVDTVEQGHKARGHEDLQLMIMCKHNIIANSSFSWWGAWLNNNTDKIVIAPQKWFNDETKNTKDLIPECWLRF